LSTVKTQISNTSGTPPLRNLLDVVKFTVNGEPNGKSKSRLVLTRKNTCSNSLSRVNSSTKGGFVKTPSKKQHKILLIDHDDSFTYILADYFAELTGEKPTILNHKKTNITAIKKLKPSHIVLSPGPGTVENKQDFAIGHKILQTFEGKIPILGVCLGHQGIGAHYGAKIIHVKPMHGKISQVYHKSHKHNLFEGLPNPFKAMRYHSLALDPKTMPPSLTVTAKTRDGVIMGIRHKTYLTFGVQFHPESIGTLGGKTILKSFLSLQ